MKPCPDCSSTTRVEDPVNGDVVCEGCGLVLGRTFSEKPRPFYDVTSSRHHIGAPPTNTLHDTGLGTTISRYTWQACCFSPQQHERNQRLRQTHRQIRIRGAEDKNLATALRHLRRMVPQLGLDRTVMEDAALIYKTALNRGALFKLEIIFNIAGAILAASKYHKRVLFMEELMKVVAIDHKIQALLMDKEGRRKLEAMLYEASRHLISVVNLKVGPMPPEVYVNYICIELDITGPPREEALSLVGKTEHLRSGRSVIGIAAAAVYHSIRKHKLDHITQQNVADVVHSGTAAIRARLKEFEECIECTVTK